MKNLIEALQIFLKYGNPDYPTHCVSEQLIINGINPDDVSDEDKIHLKELGFKVSEEYNYFYSFRYGSA